MLSRQYNRKVELWGAIDVPDGYGGNTSAAAALGIVWAEVKQLASNRDNTLGNSDFKTSYSFKVRANPNVNPHAVNLSVIYKGTRYVANEITYVDENFRFVNIVANG